MDYERIPDSYRQEQIRRLTEFVGQISSRQTTNGRVIPVESDLAMAEGRRFQAAVMFVDICNFSTRPSENEDEQRRVVNMLAILFGELVRICEDYGGEVEKNTGDGLMAWFKDTEGTPPEIDAKRAVAAALTMFDVNNSFIAPLLREAGIEPPDFRVAIDCGIVTVTKLGTAKRFNSSTIVGTTANCACKLLRLAGGSELVIGENVRTRLPAEWMQWTQEISQETGWIFRASGKQYRAYKYVGRWKR